MATTPKDSKAVKQKKTIQKIIAVTAVVLVIITALVLFFQRKVKRDYGNRGSQTVQTAQAQTGSIRTTISASGTLKSEDVVDVDISAALSVDKVHVESGDKVEEGTLLASIDASSVLTALSDVQSSLNDLDKEIRSASSETVSSYINAGVPGRVKAVYAVVGDDVAEVMYKNGALAILSLDGKMAVTLNTTAYKLGDTVTVVTSDGKEYEGTVHTLTKQTTKVLLTDDGPAYGDTVTVDGKYKGTLTVNEPLKITGYAGTVSAVSAKENAKVNGTTRVFNLKDTAYSANYNNLLKKRADFEDMYHRLVKIYKDGGIVAPVAGTVQSVTDPNESESTSSSTASASASSMSSYYAMFGMGSTTATTSASSKSSAVTSSDDPMDEFTIVTIDPGKTMSVAVNVDETDILSLALGQQVSINVDSIGQDTYYGTITGIDTNASTSDGVTQYGATVTLDRVKNMLPGMTADIAVTVEGVENALLVPADAVHRTSSTAYVYTSYDETNHAFGGMVEVEVGISNGKLTEITAGLSEGDTVFYTPKETYFTFGGMTFNSSGMPVGMAGMGGSGNRNNRPRS